MTRRSLFSTVATSLCGFFGAAKLRGGSDKTPPQWVASYGDAETLYTLFGYKVTINERIGPYVFALRSKRDQSPWQFLSRCDGWINGTSRTLTQMREWSEHFSPSTHYLEIGPEANRALLDAVHSWRAPHHMS
jgi:hypothetical protein